MANTVTLLSYANTFGDWVVTTNRLAQENNDLATNNYTKQTGTLFLNSATLGLQVANNAVIQGQLQVSGIGSSAYIQKNLQVDGSIITTGNNYFTSSDSNPVINITQSGPGLAIRISSQVGGSGTVGQNTTVIDGNGNVYIGSTTTGPFKLNVANGSVNFSNNLTVGQNLLVQGNISSPRITATSNLVSGNVFSNNMISVGSIITTPSIRITSNVDANLSIVYADQIYANGATIFGNFFLEGNTVYNSDTLGINSNALAPRDGFIISGRGPGNANAIIRWNDTNDYWDIRDVNNPVSYSKIVTANLISDSLSSTSSDTIASSRAANNLNIYSAAAYGKANAEGTINTTQNTWITNTNTLATAAYGEANTQNTVNQTQNTWINNTNTLAVAAYGEANTQNNINQTQNTWITNTNTLANAAFGKANAEGVINNTQNTWITNTNTLANAAYSRANSAFEKATAEGDINNIQNTAISSANTLATAAFGKANAEGSINNTQNTWITNTDTLATAAFNKANAATVTVTDDNSSNSTVFVVLTPQTTGVLTIANTSSSQLTYNPSTGTLSSTLFSSSSDENKKENIQTFANALSTVQQLRGVTYTWKDNGVKGIGLIAQEVEQILPELVNESENGKSISYPNIVGILVEAIKELKAEIDALKGDNK